MRAVASAQRDDVRIRARGESRDVKPFAPEACADNGKTQAVDHLCPRLGITINPLMIRSEKISAISLGVKCPPGEYH